MVPKTGKPVSRNAAPSSTYIPNKNVSLNAMTHLNTDRSTSMATVSTVSNSFAAGHSAELPDIQENLDLTFGSLLTNSYEFDPFVDVIQNQTEYLPPNPESSYQTIGSHERQEDNVQDLIKQILREVIVIKQMVEQEIKHRQESEARIQTNLDLISQNLKTPAPSKPKIIDENELKAQFQLPTTKRQQLSVFNTFLSDNPEYKESLKSRIARFGGRDHQSKLRVAMRYIVRDSALMHCTWKGTRSKDPFIAFTHINDLLKDAVNTVEAPYTDFHHNKCMVEYCKHAHFRFNSKGKALGKNKRKNKSIEVENKAHNMDDGNDDDEHQDYDDERGDYDDEHEYDDGEHDDDSDEEI